MQSGDTENMVNKCANTCTNTCATALPAGGPLLHTRSGVHRLDLRLANHFLARLRGLMLARPLHPMQGLLITRCPSVHCAFMRYPIDVVYLDSAGIVTRCVPMLRPWHASVGAAGRDADGQRHRTPRHALELSAGAIERLAIAPGDRLQHPLLDATVAGQGPVARGATSSQRGSTMIEFTLVGPLIMLLGLAMLQYGMLFFAKNQINYAAFMAARAGATDHASLAAVQEAYVHALVPLYGGGQSPQQLAEALARATADVGDNLRIELLNPTKESFDDWNDTALQTALHTNGKRVIPNANLAFKDQTVRAASGQTIQDANLIKLRITQGYQPKVPVVANLYKVYLKWLDTDTDAFHTKLVNDGRIPVVTHVTLHMQSDAIEPDSPVSTPGPGNNGTAVNSGDPATTTKTPPDCTTTTCVDGGAGSDPGDGPAPQNPSVCVSSPTMCCTST